MEFLALICTKTTKFIKGIPSLSQLGKNMLGIVFPLQLMIKNCAQVFKIVNAVYTSVIDKERVFAKYMIGLYGSAEIQNHLFSLLAINQQLILLTKNRKKLEADKFASEY